MKWYWWVMLAIGIMTMLFFGYKMFSKDENAVTANGNTGTGEPTIDSDAELIPDRNLTRYTALASV